MVVVVLCAVALAACSTSATPASTTAAPPTVPDVLAGPTVGITGHVVGAAEPDLAGLDWNTGNLSAVAPLRPPLVRIDAELGSISPRPGVVDTGPLLRKVAAIRAEGGEPLVIIDYLPAWLGKPTVAASCTGCDPTLVAPQDWAAYDGLVESVVRRLATAPQPARMFEVWNEPDLTFWNDTAPRFLELAVHTHRDVATVASEAHLALQVGGPAAAMFTADPTFIRNYVAAIEQAGLPIDFVSFHWYANYPCLGPDHPETAAERGLWEKLKCSNPDLTPASYGTLVAKVRAAVQSAVPAGRPVPTLFLDEWNMSAGGYDVRQDSNVGASFALASLIEMEDAGLTRAYYYRAVKGLPTTPGDWGIATQSGSHLPAWSILYTWARMRGGRLASVGHATRRRVGPGRALRRFDIGPRRRLLRPGDRGPAGHAAVRPGVHTHCDGAHRRCHPPVVHRLRGLPCGRGRPTRRSSLEGPPGPLPRARLGHVGHHIVSAAPLTTSGAGADRAGASGTPV